MEIYIVKGFATTLTSIAQNIEKNTGWRYTNWWNQKYRGGAMGFVLKVKILHWMRIACAVVGLGLFVGMFFFAAERTIVAIFSLFFMITGMVSQIMMAYILHNASASNRKLGKAAGLYRYI